MKKLERLLWSEILKIDLFKEIKILEVPVYFIAGRHDFQVPSILTEKYYKKLASPKGKQFIWFHNSGHLPNYEEPKRFFEVMVDLVKRETFHGDSE